MRKLIAIVIILAAMLAFINEDNKKTVHMSKTGCCTITTDHISDYQYVVTWDAVNTVDSYTTIVEVEYPDKDSSMEEQIAFELAWTLSEVKELCYTTMH